VTAEPRIAAGRRAAPTRAPSGASIHIPDPGATSRTRRRYRRIAPFYDAMEILAERRFRPWRRRLWSLAQGPRILEVGVGTGKNMPFYPAAAQVVAIDLTPAMLARARRRAEALGLHVELRQGDVQALDFADGSRR
jgi:phosphatidylethanolamine/phosphatidyl-N-methylethanolamine N-methyltransferase